MSFLLIWCVLYVIIYGILAINAHFNSNSVLSLYFMTNVAASFLLVILAGSPWDKCYLWKHKNIYPKGKG